MDAVSLNICAIMYLIGIPLFILGFLILDPRSESPKAKILIAIGVTLMVSAFFWMYSNFSVNGNKIARTEIAQTEVIKKLESNGYPISLSDLPDGSYTQLENDGSFAFVTRDSEDPLEQTIFAVRSYRKVPYHFSTRDILSWNGKSVIIKKSLLPDSSPTKIDE